MEPFGTVTKYYPLLSEKTIRTVKALLKDALSYYDFVHSLVETAQAYPMESDLACFALFLSSSFPDSCQIMQARCTESIMTTPFTYLRWGSIDPHPKEEQDELQRAIEEAASSNPYDWLLLVLYFNASVTFPEPMRTVYHDSARSLLKSNPELECFMDWQYSLEADERRNEGDIDGAIRAIDAAIELDYKNDDVICAASDLSFKAHTMKNVDVQAALQLYDKAYAMVEGRLSEFDAIYLLALNIGTCYENLGEYDLALRYYFKDFELVSRLTDHARTVEALVVSRVYCGLEMPEQALEWLRSRSKTLQFDESMLHSLSAWALVQVGEIGGATRHLMLANKLALDSGLDHSMTQYLLAQGEYELANSEFDAAISSFEEALNFRSEQFQLFVNYSLLALTRAEIARVLKESGQRDSETSGPWMTRLERHAIEKEYPGVRMQHALLKADYQMKISNREGAYLTLKNALTFSDSPGVKTLRERINHRFDELEGIAQ